MKILFTALFSIFFLLNSTAKTVAVVNPADTPNNKFGIHIFSDKDLNDASKLVNSSGGDWGYVTFVITEAERDRERWQKVFDEMRKLHLIPIVRIATKASGDSWDAPQESEINNWAGFLNSLNWVTKNRYVVIGNEPNRAHEWGGRLDAAGYADYLKKVSQKLKSSSEDFFILPAGLDPSATNSVSTQSVSKYINGMVESTPDVFDHIDGWTSHSYPHAAADSYIKELELIDKKLPVFITETGWANDKFNEQEIGEKLINTYKNVWNDPNVIAVTPFILDYTSPPFDIYSWKKSDGQFYGYYYDVQNISKIKGEPVQIESGQIVGAFAEPVIFSGMDLVGLILAKNTGQTIWSKSNIHLGNESGDFELKSISINDIEPTKFGLIFFRAGVQQNYGIYTNSIFITGKNDKRITNSFSIEGIFVNLDKAWFGNLITKIGSFF